LPHEEWRIIALFFSSERFLEAGSRGLRDLSLYSRELVFVALSAQSKGMNAINHLLRGVVAC
jgi:hypothetical protein